MRQAKKAGGVKNTRRPAGANLENKRRAKQQKLNQVQTKEALGKQAGTRGTQGAQD